VTREHKLALIVGFSLVLLVGVLISDHVSSSKRAPINQIASSEQSVTRTTIPAGVDPTNLVMHDALASKGAGSGSAAPTGSVVTPPTAGASIAQSSRSDSARSTDIPDPVAPGRLAVTGTMPEKKLGGGTTDRVIGEIDRGLAEAVKTSGGRIEVDASGNGTLHLPPMRENGKAIAQGRNLPASNEPVRTHVVGKGDTIAAISSKYYGTVTMWHKLAEFNSLKDGTVRLGQTLRVPGKDVLLGLASAPSARVPDGVNADPAPVKAVPGAKGDAKSKPIAKPDATKPRIELATYTVKRGDTLAVIAQKTMGSAKKWRELADYNKIDDEDTLTTGMVLKIPQRG
jgi:nucleoid-associated protein YgaU